MKGGWRKGERAEQREACGDDKRDRDFAIRIFTVTLAHPGPGIEHRSLGNQCIIASCIFLNKCFVSGTVYALFHCLRTVLHQWFLSLFGLPIGELWDLQALSEQCKKSNRYSFLLTSSPLNVPGLIGSPPNALAIF